MQMTAEDDGETRDAKTGEVRKDHEHPYCVEGPDPERGHDHYCFIEDEPCDEAYCFGTLPNGERDIREEVV